MYIQRKISEHLLKKTMCNVRLTRELYFHMHKSDKITGSVECFKRRDDTDVATGKYRTVATDLPRGVFGGPALDKHLLHHDATPCKHGRWTAGPRVHTASADLPVSLRRRASLKTLPLPRGYKNLFPQTTANSKRLSKTRFLM